MVDSFKIKKRDIKYSKLSFAFSIVLILTTIAYMVEYEIYFILETLYSFWSDFSPGFGIIGNFIAGCLIITGYFIGKKY